MMENWVRKRNDFEFVLCLDVSRWGRFQDIDLSATYSAECKKHGKQVIYTTLGMPRPDDPLYPVYVQFERFRAAQFSKELSAKVSHGCIRIAQQGYWVGGSPPYGYARLLLDEARKPLHVLEHRQKKGIQNQRVTLTLGPDDQVATVRRIFHEFVEAGHDTEQIAARLNRDGSRSARGGLWSASKVRADPHQRHVRRHAGLQQDDPEAEDAHAKEPGRPVGQDRGRLCGAGGPVPVRTRARRFSPRPPSGTRPRSCFSTWTTHREHGFLRASLLRSDDEAPSPSTYASRFASLDAAYQQVFRRPSAT